MLYNVCIDIRDQTWEDNNMPVINELIRSEKNGTLSFGNYELDTKSKLSDFEHCGDSYKVKTFKEIRSLNAMVHLYMNLFLEQLL